MCSEDWSCRAKNGPMDLSRLDLAFGKGGDDGGLRSEPPEVLPSWCMYLFLGMRSSISVGI